ncbi:MAG TPA: metallophosphoesterase, partial [Kofleriaceae bacterium]|nr:metallophosphoesterase [Kofleriaceae bacterium]
MRVERVRPFILLQLSDLHFGPHSRFAGIDMAGLAGRCAGAVHDAREALGWQEEVGLVLVTGDVAEAARPGEYDSALAFFGALVARLGVPRSAVVFVPGNHDVSWTRCQAVEGDLRDGLIADQDLRARLDEVKLARFNDMVARFYDPSLPRHDGAGRGPMRPAAAGSVTALPPGAHVHDFAELSVSVAALDSCEVESHRVEDHRGHLGDAQAQAVLAHWRDPQTPADRIRIVAVHHNPVPTIPAAIRAWRDWLGSQVDHGKLDAGLFDQFAADAVGFEGHEKLQAIAADAQVSLLFHGHHHASEAVHAWGWRGKGVAGDTRVISAGSLCLVAAKLPAE